MRSLPAGFCSWPDAIAQNIGELLPHRDNCHSEGVFGPRNLLFLRV